MLMNTYNNKKMPFSGVATAIATPFSRGEVDLITMRELCEWQCAMGVDAICVSGTTGEAATLTRSERRSIVASAKEILSDKIPLIVGCGSSDTSVACSYCREAVMLGADALLVITPYCNKGTKSGIIEHFKAVADAADGRDVILYNVPSRTGVDLSLEQYEELAKIENVCAVKEAAVNMTRITRLCKDGILTVYSGNDDMILPVISAGGMGVVSVLSNLVPAEVASMTRLAIDGDFKSAREIAHRYAYLVELLFAETNPAPLKYAMSQMGLCSGEMRLPMGEISDSLKQKISSEMKKLDLVAR